MAEVGTGPRLVGVISRDLDQELNMAPAQSQVLLSWVNLENSLHLSGESDFVSVK